MAKAKKPGHRVVAVVDVELVEMMRHAVYASRQTISSFVQDAIAARLANYEDSVAFVRTKRKRYGLSSRGVFDLTKVDRFGWPHDQINPNVKKELHRQYSEGGTVGLRAFMQLLWTTSELGEYTPADLKETLWQLEH